MVKKLTILYILIIIGLFCSAQKPNWIKNKPTPSNNTYRYAVEWATGDTEIEARNFAIAEIFRSTAMRLGQPFDSESVFNALQNGTDYNVISSRYNIPINKVCEYFENDGSQYRVYILCQVAEAGNIVVSFDDFNKCYEGNEGIYGREALYVKGKEIYRNDKELYEGEIRTLFANSKSYALYDKGSRMIDRSDALMGIGGGTVVVSGLFWLAGIIGSEDFSDNTMWISAACMDGVGIGIFITGAMLPSFGKAKIRKAVNLYNNGKMYSYLDFGFSYIGNGIAISLTF